VANQASSAEHLLPAVRKM